MAEILNFSDATPAAPSNSRNVKWQKGATTGNDPATGYPVYPVSANVPYMVGDSGSGGAAGLVPPPAAGDAAAGKVLKADGTWYVPPSLTNPMTTVGDLIVGGTAGTPTRLAANAAGLVLTSNGPGVAPSYQSAGAGGGGWGGGEAAFTTPILTGFTQDNFGTTGTSTVAESFTAAGTPAIRLRERGAGGNTNHLRSLIVVIPTATSKWTMTARLRVQNSLGSWHDLGLVLKDSISGKFIHYGWGADIGSPFVYTTWASSNSTPASANADNSTVAPRLTFDLWLQIYYDGTNLNFQYSRDGQYFITCKQTTATAYLTNPANWCGIGINPNNTYNSLVETVLECFSFSVVNS